MTISKKFIKDMLKVADNQIKTLTLEIPIHMHHLVLVEAGYTLHTKGWVKDSSTKRTQRRFHVVSLSQDLIEIHVDKTIYSKKLHKNLHMVEENESMLKSERGNIKKVWKKYDPVYLAKQAEAKNKLQMKVGRRGEFAPNLAQIQKHKPPIAKPPGLIHKVIRFIKNFGAIIINKKKDARQ